MRVSCQPGPDALALNKKEEAMIEEIKKKYYQDNWSTVIMNFLRFANPNIANA